MNLIDRILRRCQRKTQELPLLEGWIAPGQSLYPATTTTLSWKPKYSTASEARVILFLSLFRREWESWDIIESIKQQAYFQRYQGDWNQVQEILEQDFNYLRPEEKIAKFVRTEDDFFGNFLPACERLLKENPKGLREDRTKLSKPRRIVRRRGYKDKGLRRPFDKRGRSLPDPDPGEDRRDLVRFGSLP